MSRRNDIKKRGVNSNFSLKDIIQYSSNNTNSNKKNRSQSNKKKRKRPLKLNNNEDSINDDEKEITDAILVS